MAVNFPPNPSIGDTVTDPVSGAVWTWDGYKWTFTPGGGTPPPPTVEAADLISADPDNALVLGTDDLLFVPESSGGGGGGPLDTTGNGSTYVLQNQPTVNQPVIMGVTDGSAAQPGQVGEYQSVDVVPANSVPIGGGATDITSLPLTAGDWDIGGVARITNGAAAGCITSAQFWLNTASAANPGANSNIVRWVLQTPSGAQQEYGLANNSAILVKPLRVNVAAGFTAYLSMLINSQSAGAQFNVCGSIWARRMR